MKTVAIVDGDIIAFRSCPPRRKKGEPVFLDDKGHQLPPKWKSAQEEEDYFQETWRNFSKSLSELAEKLYCDEMLVAIGGVRNFREDIFFEYKQHRHRDPAFANTTVPRVRQRAVDEGLAIQALGYEADDLIRIWSNECRANEFEFVIVSMDKDLLCIPGTHYLWHKSEILHVDELSAHKSYYSQLLSGDLTDNIPGLPGIGPKTAVKILAECSTEREMQDLVAWMYKETYGEEWHSYLLSNGKLLHILNHPDDYFTADDWEIVKELK